MEKFLYNFKINTQDKTQQLPLNKIPKEYYIEKTKQPKQPKVLINRKLKQTVWEIYMSENNINHPCFCCKITIIKNTDFDCAHVIAASKGGSCEIDNLRPICSKCNKSMSTKNMYQFIDDSGFWYRNITMDDIEMICSNLLVNPVGNKGQIVHKIRYLKCRTERQEMIRNKFIKYGETENPKTWEDVVYLCKDRTDDKIEGRIKNNDYIFGND